jgi:predicted  nucleic acid-binding Zn-ribbon protein
MLEQLAQALNNAVDALDASLDEHETILKDTKSKTWAADVAKSKSKVKSSLATAKARREALDAEFTKIENATKGKRDKATEDRLEKAFDTILNAAVVIADAEEILK